MKEQMRLPTRPELERQPATRLIRDWQTNHDALRGYVLRHELPYFGLHGTNQANLDSLLMSNCIAGPWLEVATFYEKDRSERRLFQFYHAVQYTSYYTRKEGQTGGIIILDLEKDGKNVTCGWERLASNSGSFDIATDTEAQKGHFQALRQQENLFWRACVELTREEFAARYKGVLRLDDSAYLSLLRASGGEGLLRAILQQRFMQQDLVAQLLDALEKH